MNITAHLVKFDVRRSRALLIVWMTLLAVQAALAVSGVNPGDRVTQSIFGMISQIVPPLEALLLFVFVPFLILSDPVVGTTAFWLTRPISRPTLVKSKTLSALAVLVLPPVAVEIIIFVANGLSLHDVALVVPEIILAQLSLIIAVATIAVLTPNFGRYAIAGLAFVVAMMILALTFQWMRMYLDFAGLVRREMDFSLSRSSSIATSLWIIFAGGVVVAHQYFTRRTARSMAAAIGVAVASLAVQQLWSWDFLTRPLPKLAQEPFDTSAVKIVLNSNLFAQETTAASGQGAPDKTIYATVEAIGLPSSYAMHPKRIRPHLQSADGSWLKAREDLRGSGVIEILAEALEAALGGIPVVNASPPSTSCNLFVVDADTYGKYADQPLTFSADMDCVALKYVMTAEIPVAKGSRSDRGRVHFAIMDVLRQSDGVDIILRVREPNLLFDPENKFRPGAGPGYRSCYLLVNRRRNEAVLQKRDGYDSIGSFAPFAEPRLVNRPVRLSFGPEPQWNRLTPVLNAEWLADAELVRLDLTPVLEFSTRLVVEKLKLNGKSAFKHLIHEVPPKEASLPKITLPENATKEQVRDYINEVLVTVQRQKKSELDESRIGMLVKVGANNLDVLIDVRSGLGSRHTVDWNAGDLLDSYLNTAIKRLVRAEDKDLIIRALPFDKDLAEIVNEKGFLAEARETLLAELSRKEADLPISWIKAVASLQDASTYPQLKAYFVRCDNRQSVFAAIRGLPGIELTDAVDEAWKKAKYDTRQAIYMCPIAAEYGKVEALDTAANVLRTATRDDYLRDARGVLTKFTTASGDDAALLAWFDANRGKLLFDSQTKKFIVKS